MVGPDVHEVTQLRARNEHLEAEHARLMELTAQQADEMARLRSALQGIAYTEPAMQVGVEWVHWRCQARAALRS